MKAIFYPCACFCTVATKSVLAFYKNYPTQCKTSNAWKTYSKTANCLKTTPQVRKIRHNCKLCKNTAFNCKIRKNTALLQIFTKIQHHCKLPQKHLTAKMQQKNCPKGQFFTNTNLFFVQQHCNACALAFTISVLSTFWAKGSATAGRFPTCPEALLRKAQFWTKANTCSNPTQRCRRQGLCCSDRTPLPLCLLQ